MARRSKDQGGGLLLLVALVVAAVAVVGPFVVAGWSIFAELRARKFRYARRASELITNDDSIELNSREQRLAEIEHQVLALEESGLARRFLKRSDGFFDARNPQARVLNDRMERLLAERAEALVLLEMAKNRVAHRIEVWLKARAGVVGARAGLLTFVGVFVAMTANSLVERGVGVSVGRLLFGDPADGGDRVLASVVATICAGLATWLGGSAARASLR